MVDRIAEQGAVQYGQDRWSFENNDSRLAGAGQIANEIRRLVEEGKYTDYVSGLSVKGRLINRMIDVVYWPRKLFANNELGAWYDPSDYSTLFQDAAGTTPVTAIEQPVGLMLDKSKGSSAIGSERISNNTFDSDTVWTKGTGWAIGSGVATKTAGTASLLSQPVTLTVGKTYRVIYTITRTAGAIVPRFTGGTDVTGTSRAASGTYADFLTAVTGNNTFDFSADASFAGTVDNVYIKEITGNDAYQLTATARPVLRARYNLLTYSEQFDNAAWTKPRVTVSSNAITAPDGTNTGTSILETATTGTHSVYRAVFTTSAVPHTFSFYAKGGLGRQWAFINAYVNGNNVTYFDIVNGVVGTNAAGNTASIENVGDGWYRCSVTRTAGVNTAPEYGAAESDGTFSYAGDITKGIYIWGADLRVTNDALNQPSYQRIAAATDYDVVNFKPYLAFDGSDDWLVTNSIDFTGTDKMTVFAGVRKLSDATLQTTITELSASSTSNNGTFWLAAPWTSSLGGYGFRSRGTLAALAFINDTPTAPITNVLTGIGNISGDSTILKINGTQVASHSADQGTGNYGNYPLYIGSRAGTSLRFNGRLYGLIVRGAQSTDAEITNTETWLNNKTGAY